MKDMRVPPQNMDAERSVLGAAMSDENALSKIIGIMGNGSWFYSEKHRKIYAAISALYVEQSPVDLVTVTKQLQSTSEVETVGGVEYLDGLIESLPTAANADYYCEMVREDALRRLVIKETTTAYNKAFSEAEELDDIVSSLEQSLLNVRKGQGITDAVTVKSIMPEVFGEVNRIYDTKEYLVGLPSGIPELDEMTAGFQNGDYVLVAARASMGKSTFVRNIAQYVGLEKNVGVLIFSLEVSAKRLVMRMLASEARIPFHDMRRGRMTEEDMGRVSVIAGRLAEIPVLIDDTPALKPSILKAKCQMVMAQHDIGLVIVDHIHDMIPDEKYGNSEAEMSQISGALKATARQLDVPLIAAAQLNRGPENRPDKRPQMRDLRGSGGLEQDGDLILFLYRDSYYPDIEGATNETEIIVGKQRNGPVGTVRVYYDQNTDKLYPLFKGEVNE